MPGVAERATLVGSERSSGRVVMNVLHRWVCASSRWRQRMEDYTLPWVLDGIDRECHRAALFFIHALKVNHGRLYAVRRTLLFRPWDLK